MNTSIDLTQIVICIIGLIAALITRYAIPYFKSKTTDQQWAIIERWVYVAVSAMETIYTESGMGEAKKAEVIAFVQKMCDQYGFKMDIGAVELAIQEAWDTLGLNNKSKITV